MTAREQVIQVLENLDDDEVQQVADYLAFLRFRARQRGQPASDPPRFGALYGAFADEDRRTAELGMADFAEGLRAEDRA